MDRQAQRLQSELTESFTWLSMQAYTCWVRARLCRVAKLKNCEAIFFCFLRGSNHFYQGICHNSAGGHLDTRTVSPEIGNVGSTKIDVHLQDNHQTYLG